jgi:hypothetical protein
VFYNLWVEDAPKKNGFLVHNVFFTKEKAPLPPLQMRFIPTLAALEFLAGRKEY